MQVKSRTFDDKNGLERIKMSDKSQLHFYFASSDDAF